MPAVHVLRIFAFLFSMQLVLGDNNLMWPFKHVAFERICWENVYSNEHLYINRYFKIRDKVVCGIKCLDTPSCLSFAFFEDEHLCWLYSGKMADKIEDCSKKNWDYGEL